MAEKRKTIAVKFTKVILPYMDGETAHFSEKQAAAFVKSRVAEYVDAPAAVPATLVPEQLGDGKPGEKAPPEGSGAEGGDKKPPEGDDKGGKGKGK